MGTVILQHQNQIAAMQKTINEQSTLIAALTAKLNGPAPPAITTKPTTGRTFAKVAATAPLVNVTN